MRVDDTEYTTQLNYFHTSHESAYVKTDIKQV